MVTAILSCSKLAIISQSPSSYSTAYYIIVIIVVIIHYSSLSSLEMGPSGSTQSCSAYRQLRSQGKGRREKGIPPSVHDDLTSSSSQSLRTAAGCSRGKKNIHSIVRIELLSTDSRSPRLARTRTYPYVRTRDRACTYFNYTILIG